MERSLVVALKASFFFYSGRKLRNIHPLYISFIYPATILNSSIHSFIHPSIIQPLFIHPSIHPFIHNPSISLFTLPYIHPSIHPFIHPSLFSSIIPLVTIHHPFIHPFTRPLFFHPFLYSSCIHPSIRLGRLTLSSVDPVTA